MIIELKKSELGSAFRGLVAIQKNQLLPKTLKKILQLKERIATLENAYVAMRNELINESAEKDANGKAIFSEQKIGNQVFRVPKMPSDEADINLREALVELDNETVSIENGDLTKEIILDSLNSYVTGDIIEAIGMLYNKPMTVVKEEVKKEKKKKVQAT